MIELNTPLQNIYGIGPKFLTRLNRMGMKTVEDLVWHLPFRYEDFSAIAPISEVSEGQRVTVAGIVVKIDSRKSFRRNLSITEANVQDETGIIKAVWFNQPYVKNALIPKVRFNFSGKVMGRGGELYMSNPQYEMIGGKETRHTARLVPIYPETRGLTSKGLRYLLQPILKSLPEMKDTLPDEILDKYGLPDINEAVRDVHFPNRIEEAERARKRFAFEELFRLSIVTLERREALNQERARAIKINIEAVKKMVKTLPFQMTVSQRRCLFEILKDMERSRPMNRLLQGDVGSGKTVVAALAAKAVVRDGYQAVFMVPTEILARQHYKTIISLPGGESVGLLTGGLRSSVFYGQDLETEVKKEELKKKIGKGEIKIIIGTQALLEKGVEFKKLGLLVIDEQHRFGVRQRAQLTEARGKTLPHFLSMSATPIPRTLTLTIFGDLDLSTITELPLGREEIETRIVAPENRGRAHEFIRKQVRGGRQVFVVCPRIEKAEDEGRDIKRLELASVNNEYKKLTEEVFPELRIAKLHGKMKSKEKEGVMSDFKDGQWDILVSTSVVEVGIDVPNATVMMIEGAERFGLAQLYQFRGRVGRGRYKSYCFLFSEAGGETAEKRLRALKEAKNGFELAEKDLEIRGPGQFLGNKQTGLPDTAMSSLRDISLISEAREAAMSILERDPKLKKYPVLKESIREFKEKIHEE